VSRLISAVVIAGALALIVWGVGSAQTGDSVDKPADPAIERLIPNPGEIVLRQSQVGIDLASGYRGVLIIDGQEIPTTDVPAGANPVAATTVNLDAQFDPATNTVLFVPKKGATIEEFTPGDHRITAVYWREDETRDQASSYSWSFKVS
jgi:hypothetical protein